MLISLVSSALQPPVTTDAAVSKVKDKILIIECPFIVYGNKLRKVFDPLFTKGPHMNSGTLMMSKEFRLLTLIDSFCTFTIGKVFIQYSIVLFKYSLITV